MDLDILPIVAGVTTYQAFDAMDRQREREDLLRRQEALRLLDEQDEEDRRELEEERNNSYDDWTEIRRGGTPEWDEYIGQVALKERLMLAIKSAKVRDTRLDHILLASGMPGVGKTTMARIIAKEMGVRIIEMVPPFKTESLVAAASDLEAGDILFIDEIHKLAETGKRGAEVLLKLLEEHTVFIQGQAIRLADITVIGATTDADMLPEPVIDRFKIKPFFEKYTEPEMVRITCNFLEKHDYDWDVEADEDLIIGIADAARSTPRVTEEFAIAVRDMAAVRGRRPTIDEVLGYMQVEPDGMTRQHIAYLTNMYRFNKRTVKQRVEWVAGEAVMMSMLRETRQGIARIERFLMEMGYIDRTPSGRRLTPAGISKAIHYIDNGK